MERPVKDHGGQPDEEGQKMERPVKDHGGQPDEEVKRWRDQ